MAAQRTIDAAGTFKRGETFEKTGAKGVALSRARVQNI